MKQRVQRPLTFGIHSHPIVVVLGYITMFPSLFELVYDSRLLDFLQILLDSCTSYSYLLYYSGFMEILVVTLTHLKIVLSTFVINKSFN